MRERRAPEGHEAKGAARLPGATFGRRAGVAGIGLLGVVVLSGCTLAQWERAAMPEPVTVEGETTLGFWQGSWIAAMAVGILVWGLIIWAVIAYRRRKGDNTIPVQTKYNMPIETFWTIAPLIMVIGIFFFAYKDTNYLDNVSSDNKQTINVVAFRWSWTFNYVNEDTYDTGQPAYTSQQKDSGPVPATDPGIPTLWLPVNQKVKFELTSPDVIHSFWVIDFLYKLDIVPGRTNVFEATPKTVGTYAGKCAELCGVDHSRMLFQVKVVTQEEFDAHMEDLRARGQGGQLLTGRTTDRAQGV